MSDYWNENLKKTIKPGNKVKLFFNEGNRNNQIMEIREIVDEDYIVYRVYDMSEDRYDYHIQYIYLFYLYDREDCLTLLSKETD